MLAFEGAVWGPEAELESRMKEGRRKDAGRMKLMAVWGRRAGGGRSGGTTV